MEAAFPRSAERLPRRPAARARNRTFVRREDADRFIEEVRGDDPEIASNLRIEERELDAGERT